MKTGKKCTSSLIAGLIILMLWQLLSLILRLPVVPSPFLVLGYLFHIFFSKIFIHGLYSIGRVFGGVILSIAVGMPLGLMMGYYKSWDRVLSPITYLVYPVPKIALLPVVMVLFGLGEFSKIIMIMLIVVFQVIVASRDSVKKIPRETYYSLYSLGASHVDIFKKIVVPAVLPELLTSIRIGLGTAVSVLFFTETFGTEYGMGYFIMDAWMRINYIEMYSGIIVLSLIGFTLFGLVDFLERRLCPWK